jgi:undecaprenyl diphosphate synthase
MRAPAPCRGADNWRRPTLEVRALMALFAHHVRTDTPRLVREDVRLEIIGRRDRLPRDLIAAIDGAQSETAGATGLHLRIAIDYSARAAITAGAVTPDVDLLIRTGGEQRLSDFLLWEAAYAELLFTNTMWPDFGEEEFASALRAFAARERRFGGLAAGA